MQNPGLEKVRGIGQSWLQPPFGRLSWVSASVVHIEKPAKSRLRAKLPAPLRHTTVCAILES
jgi:hypothetical protein